MTGDRTILINCSIMYSIAPMTVRILKNGSTSFRVVPWSFILFPPNVFFVRHIDSSYKVSGLTVEGDHLIPATTYTVSYMI